MVIQLIRYSQRPMCSSDYQQKTLINEIQPNNFISSSIISIDINLRTDNYFVHVYLSMKDKRQNNSKLTGLNTVCMQYVKLKMDENFFSKVKHIMNAYVRIIQKFANLLYF